MSTLVLAADERVVGVEVTEDELTVRLMDGRAISAPLVWYPRLLNATAEQRKNWRISGGGYGIHWEDIDEDLSTRGLLLGIPASQQSAMQVSQAKEYPKGKLDYLVQVENAGNEIYSILSEIGAQFVEATSKIHGRVSSINSGTNLPAGQTSHDMNSVALLLASDMTELSNSVEESTQRFNRNRGLLEEGYLAYISLLKVHDRGNEEHLGRVKNSLISILTTAQGLIEPTLLVKGNVQTFREQVFSSALTEATDRVLNTLNVLQESINEFESFPLRVLFQVDEKLGAA